MACSAPRRRRGPTSGRRPSINESRPARRQLRTRASPSARSRRRRGFPPLRVGAVRRARRPGRRRPRRARCSTARSPGRSAARPSATTSPRRATGAPRSPHATRWSSASPPRGTRAPSPTTPPTTSPRGSPRRRRTPARRAHRRTTSRTSHEGDVARRGCRPAAGRAAGARRADLSVLDRFAGEPTVRELQRAAARLAEVHPELRALVAASRRQGGAHADVARARRARARRADRDSVTAPI